MAQSRPVPMEGEEVPLPPIEAALDAALRLAREARAPNRPLPSSRESDVTPTPWSSDPTW